MSALPSSDFFAHHSPFGAFASFTVGRWGKKGGFGLELGGPARQDVYVAVSRPGQGVRALPFYAGAQSGGAEAYTGEAADSRTASPAWKAFGAGEIRRTMGWASDTWTAGDLTFRLMTPFGPVPRPETLGVDELRRHLCPTLLAEITIDNTRSTTEAFGFFGIGAEDPLRPLSDADDNKLQGIACETRWGFAVVPDETTEGNVREVLSWSLLDAVAKASSSVVPPLHRLANRGGVLLRVGPGESRTWTLVLGFYRGGIVTSGIPASYLYGKVFAGLEDVLAHGVDHAADAKARAAERDAELDAAALTDERKFLLAHATHSYHGSTQLLHDERATAATLRPLWAVNEGEYRMLNTFDLTVDHAFWELRFHPWTLQNTLDLYADRYAYTDQVQNVASPGRPRSLGGISFTHDMGVANQWSPPGLSSYELADLPGCFSQMTMEQLCNWCLCAALYGLNNLSGHAGDRAWLSARQAILNACLESLLHRDASDAEQRNGILRLDSMRCGSGQEITTYDSLDNSLGQARANGYLAVKTWATFLALERCFDAVGDDERARSSRAQADLATASITAHWDVATGCFPAVFEADNPGYTSRIIPAIEGLVYPFVLNDHDAVSDNGPYGELVRQLRRHFETVLVPGVCIDSASNGWKLSSSSNNTWMSKIFLSQFVAESVLGVGLSPDFDAAHAGWQRDGDCRNFAFTDQVYSPDGRDLGSRFYPRGVTAILWLPPFAP